ncbi:MAG: TMEM175 family protein [bacterium]
MTKGRIEAFSDGVIAIIITIMVLEMKVPHGEEFRDLLPLWPVLLSYILSFINVGIYWNNHHHMFHAVKHVGGWVLWANLHLLFWLSLMPFASGFMGENHFGPVPVFLYAVDVLMCAVAYSLLERALVGQHGRDSEFAKSLKGGRKEQLSTLLYVLAIGSALWIPELAMAFMVTVAAIWIIPDRRFSPVGVKE